MSPYDDHDSAPVPVTQGKGSYVPFRGGHTVSMTAGHRSPRVYGELAQQLSAGLMQNRSDLAGYPEAVAAWATAEAQAALLRRHLGQVGPLDENDQPRDAVLKWLTSLEKQAAARRSELGLDPRSEASLARERAAATVLHQDLSGLAERGRQALAERSAAGEEPAPDLAGEALARVNAEGRAVMDEARGEHYAAGLGRPENVTPRQPRQTTRSTARPEDGSTS